MSSIYIPTYTFTRPSDTTAYSSGDLVADSTTAGSVIPISWNLGQITVNGGFLRRVRLHASNTSTTNASFRIHFYSSAPTCANGDNGAWSTTLSGYRGSTDITLDKAFTDGAAGIGVPASGSEISMHPMSTSIIYALIEARGAYTPASAQTFTISPEIHTV